MFGACVTAANFGLSLTHRTKILAMGLSHSVSVVMGHSPVPAVYGLSFRSSSGKHGLTGGDRRERLVLERARIRNLNRLMQFYAPPFNGLQNYNQPSVILVR